MAQDTGLRKLQQFWHAAEISLFEICGKRQNEEGDSLKALYYLRRSLEIDPQDPQTVYGLAFGDKATSSRPRSISKRSWRWKLRRTCAAWPGTGCGRSRLAS